MSARVFLIWSFALMMPLGAMADDAARLTSPGPFTGFITEVQRRLHEEGFDAGPLNGDFGARTQAALAQFQLAQALPASGALDGPTLAALGVKPPASGAAGASR